MNIRKLDARLPSADFRELSYQLLHRDGYLPDCYKDIKRFTEQWEFMMGRSIPPVGVYDGDKLLGFWFISDVAIGHEGTFYMWLWGGVKPSVVKAMREYIDTYARECGLCRLVCHTPDEKGYGRLLNCLGLKLESRAKNAWKSNGRLGVLFTYRKLWPYNGGGM